MTKMYKYVIAIISRAELLYLMLFDSSAETINRHYIRHPV